MRGGATTRQKMSSRDPVCPFVYAFVYSCVYCLMLTARQYIEALRDLRKQIEPEEFVRANNYIQAAGKVVGAFEMETSWASIQSTSELALRLTELYPEGLPLTFPQLAQMLEQGIPTPPPRQIPDWWAGRV